MGSCCSPVHPDTVGHDGANKETTPWLITQNVKEVSWPPPATQIKEKQVLDSIKTLPNLSGAVHMGKARRQRMDEEFERVVESSAAKYTSHPFTKGKHTISRTWVYWRVSEGFQPS